jgi:RecA/RadA recombinase
MSKSAKLFKSQFAKTMEKFDSDTINLGFKENIPWLSMGNYAMNRRFSGYFNKSFMFGTSFMAAGISQSGKSLAMSMAAIEHMKEGGMVFWLDVEKATIHKDWFIRAGLDPESDLFDYSQAGTVEDVKKAVATIVKIYKEVIKTDPEFKVFIVIDSISSCQTESQYDRAVSGEVKGDQGQQAKQIKDMILSFTHLIASKNIIIGGILHSMASMDMYDPGEKTLGGRGVIYMAGAVFMFEKKALKAEKAEAVELVNDVDGSKVVGNLAKVKLLKSRISKPNEDLYVQMIMPHGVDPYSGLFDVLKDDGYIEMAGAWATFKLREHAEEIREKFYRKDFRKYADKMMDIITRFEAGEYDGVVRTDHIPKPIQLTPEQMEAYDPNTDFDEYVNKIKEEDGNGAGKERYQGYLQVSGMA